MPYKKLIETSLPVSKINSESEREKTARNGLPSSVHIWWSRRSMAAARSIIFASLVDDPAGHPEIFPTEEDQSNERTRLLQMVEDLSVVENASNEQLLLKAKDEISRYAGGVLPAVFDPFVGGGTIPVEAQRLGLNAISADLNAVAATITTVISDIPYKFANMRPVHQQENVMLDFGSAGAQGLAEDIRYYGEWMIEEAFKRIGHLYPKITNSEDGKDLSVSAWIWARTIKCPNPACGSNIPLSSSYDLAKKKGSEAWVEPVVENSIVKFTMHREEHTEKKGKPKVAKTAVFKCPACGEITPDAYVKECGINHQIQSQLIAIVADDGKKRLYFEPDIEQETIADVMAPPDIPHGELPNFPKRFSPPSFGLTDYADLFTNRQLIFITTMFKLTIEVQNEIEKQAIAAGLPADGVPLINEGHGALAYAQAVRTVLALTVSKLLDRCSNFCSWSSSSGGSLRNVFSRAAMPMIWDYAEGNPFASAGGSFKNALSRTCEAIAVLPTSAAGRTMVADGTQQNDVHNAIISTDLPYYDRASYADLSDFFYVWLKYGIGDLYPKYFAADISPKKEELTAFSYRWNNDKKQADAFYGERLNLAFSSMYESAAPDYPSTMAFIYKGNDSKNAKTDSLSEWESFITAICSAGFMITASWPLGRKYEGSIELAESRGIPITVVVRKREEDAPQTTRRFFVAAVKRELPLIIERLHKQVDPKDLRAAVIGQALNIYTRNKQVLDADGSNMKAHIASRIIEQEINTMLSDYYEKSEVKDENEEETIHG